MVNHNTYVCAYDNILHNEIKQTNILIEMGDRRLFTWEDVLELICEEQNDEGLPEIMFPGIDKEFGLYKDDDDNDEPR